jgi:hypothetical protein
VLPINLGLVSQTTNIDASALSQTAAALQKQVTRDFGPLWSIQATVDAFASLQDLPVGYWPIIVRDDINTPGAAGVHEDKNKQPFALVQYSNSWSLTASHECLEMLADPFGNRIMAGQSPKRGQGRVEFLVEVGDPCEAAQFAYTSNGFLVSDFITPHFYDPVKSAGVRYSYTGAITGPREILKGGYISWHDPVSNHWWQEVWFGARRQFRDLGVLGDLTGSLRETIDAMTPHTELVEGVDPKNARLVAAQQVSAAIDESAAARAVAIQVRIDELKSGAVAPGSTQ